jgi:hypothetical protein
LKSINSRVLASAHDLGGANQLIFALKDFENVDFVLTGPALEVGKNFQIRLVDAEVIQISDYSHFFVASNFERSLSDSLLVLAHQSNLKTVGILDHWVDLDSRWEITPDKILTTDIWAFLNAFRHYNFRTKLVRNQYIESARKRLVQSEALKFQSHERIGLVILQPVHGGFRHELHLSNCFCRGIAGFIRQNNLEKLILREHVNTPSAVCINYLGDRFPGVLISRSGWDKEIYQDLGSVTHVIGMDSYALYVAKKLGRKTYAFTTPRNWCSPRYKRLFV